MTTSQPPLLSLLIKSIITSNPMQEDPLEEILFTLWDEEKNQLEQYLSFCSSINISIDILAKAYNTITMDTLREQIFFQRHGRYRYSSFEEVANKVYFDPQYMTYYMYGLALTLFLWPNHLEVFRFFKSKMPCIKKGRYLEIGPGHGFFFKYAAQNSKLDLCLGVDISPTSLEMTRQLLTLESSLRNITWKLINADFLTMPDTQEKFDAIVMGEVLEHVEQPLLFLLKIKEFAKENTFIFITTVINAPAVDHIYLFKILMKSIH